MPDAAEPRPLRLHVAVSAGVAAAVLVAFLPVVQNGFLQWDDQHYFLNNEAYRGLGPEQLKWMFSSFLLGHYQPLAWVTLGADYLVWGMNPAGYHLTSLLFHAASTVGLYFVLTALMRLSGIAPAAAPAALGALLWGLHPLRVESVAWAVERRDVVCGFFLMLTLLAWFRWVEERRAGRPGRRAYVLALLFFAASLLSKSLGIMLPWVMLVLDVHPFGRFRPGGRRRVLLEKVPFALLSIADAAVMSVGMATQFHEGASYGILDRTMQASFALWFYLWKTLVPLGLSPLYPLEGADLRSAVFVACAAATVAAAVAGAMLLRRRRSVLAAAASYVLLVFPVLGLVAKGYQLVADRYTYLSLLPLSALAAGLLARAGPLALRAAGGALILLGAVSFTQVRHWRDTFSLWDRAIESGWPSSIAHKGRGTARMALGDLPGALQDLDEAVRRDPRMDDAFAFRAEVRASLGDGPGAAADFAEALRIRPGFAQHHFRRAVVREQLGDAAGALADYDETLRLFRDYAKAYSNRGRLRAAAGDREGALSDMSQVLRLSPRHAPTLVARGRLREETGDPAGALEDYSQALSIAPGAEAHRRRGALLAARGDTAGGLADYDAAVRLDPRDAEAWMGRGALKASLGGIREGLADLGEAVRLAPALPLVWHNRGLARLAAGDRKGALGDFEEALRRAPPDWSHRAAVEARIAELK